MNYSIQRPAEYLDESQLIISIAEESTGSKENIYIPTKRKNQKTQKPSFSEAIKNLFANGSFELNPQTTESKWQKVGVGSKQIVEWSNEQAASGEYALKISAAYPHSGWPGWHSSQLDYKPDSGYEIQAKYFTSDGANTWLVFVF